MFKTKCFEPQFKRLVGSNHYMPLTLCNKYYISIKYLFIILITFDPHKKKILENYYLLRDLFDYFYLFFILIYFFCKKHR
jgi:hypothetical protein